ncbi:DUF262 domain-containing protein [Mycobacteroides abscessus subsp. abscessus]|uniref:DUF262 domain-containing protein n=1 Tax=Mycobacteroides abscessus TaxID=36809 RepID=UPI0005DC6619|nr:DUF262 domain-containing protein [Mycobacteroides abscessus]CPR91943.1 Uncharacterized conserved protein [Mycobacteroides abscessus]CPS50066.1 Uncharacterized conserved protein [Mycobacteroides abscessus]CPY47566.1 Uncharacterized conserved protein [Mycobacteroides abscessus]CPY51017.1 Uncharacterized conserved protein [Mycobacteroides abscessus]SLI41779.1 Uncharacterized conserved protein [Mycobacteroides abscessus subsp. abscessus]
MTRAEKHALQTIVEDVFDGEATGVEVEDIGDSESVIERPWNPDQIRVTTGSFSLRNILDQIDEGSLELAPDFQRGKVWKSDQKSLLVESLLLQIPLPAFYFAEDGEGAFRVVDGLQRLSTLHAFVRGGKDAFALRGLEYLKDAEGARFDDLAVQWQRRINNTQLVVNIIDPTTPTGVMYDIFKRINTGGTPLNAQEIRHCMSKARSRDILKRMTHTKQFSDATRLTDHIRMNDREVALRFVAFWLFGVEEYMEYPVMENFLMKATIYLDSKDEISDAKVAELEKTFKASMSKVYALFGENSFRKWPLESAGRSPINRALFESWSVAVAGYNLADLKRRKDFIIHAARDRMTNDSNYIDSITSSTADRRRVLYRFQAAARDVQAGL